MLAVNPDFSWWGIRSRDHFNRSGTSNFHKILDFLGRDPIIFGINTKIGNFKPKCIFWEGFWREMGLDLMENGGWRWSDIWGNRKIGFWGSYGMVWRIRGGNLHEIAVRIQWNRSRDLKNILKIWTNLYIISYKLPINPPWWPVKRMRRSLYDFVYTFLKSLNLCF